MNYKLYAFADEACGDLAGQIQAMQRNGLQGVELRNVDGCNVSGLTAEKAREIRQRLDDAGLIVWSAGSPIGKIDVVHGDYAAHLDQLRNTLEVCHILGADKVRMFSFYVPQNEDPAKYRSVVIERLCQMSEMAADANILLCHENEKGIYGDNAERCLDVLTHVPGLRGVFDPANFVQCGQDTAQAWAMLKPYINYLHIKDALANGQVVPAGMGIGNVAAIVRDFCASGSGAMTLEPHLFDFVGLAALEREGDKSVVGQLHFADANAAFDASVNALKAILANA